MTALTAGEERTSSPATASEKGDEAVGDTSLQSGEAICLEPEEFQMQFAPQHFLQLVWVAQHATSINHIYGSTYIVQLTGAVNS